MYALFFENASAKADCISSLKNWTLIMEKNLSISNRIFFFGNHLMIQTRSTTYTKTIKESHDIKILHRMILAELK